MASSVGEGQFDLHEYNTDTLPALSDRSLHLSVSYPTLALDSLSEAVRLDLSAKLWQNEVNDIPDNDDHRDWDDELIAKPVTTPISATPILRRSPGAQQRASPGSTRRVVTTSSPSRFVPGAATAAIQSRLASISRSPSHR